MNNIIFLDFDGVVRIPIEGRMAFSKHILKGLADICERQHAKIVVSSDWRVVIDRVLENADEIKHMLGPLAPYLHQDGGTPILGSRVREILSWLEDHPDSNYAVLDDVPVFFAGAPRELQDRLIICNARHGARAEELIQLMRILRGSESLS
jgi:hypothetical protein